MLSPPSEDAAGGAHAPHQRTPSRSAGGRSRLIFEPARVGRPVMSNRFFTAKGTPASGPALAAAPAPRRAAAASAQRAVGGDVGEGVDRRDRAAAIRASAASATAVAVTCRRRHRRGDLGRRSPRGRDSLNGRVRVRQPEDRREVERGLVERHRVEDRRHLARDARGTARRPAAGRASIVRPTSAATASRSASASVIRPAAASARASSTAPRPAIARAGEEEARDHHVGERHAGRHVHADRLAVHEAEEGQHRAGGREGRRHLELRSMTKTAIAASTRPVRIAPPPRMCSPS